MRSCTFKHKDDEDEDGGAESELDESESEAEAGAEEEKQSVQKEEDKEAKSDAQHKYVTTTVMAPSGIKGHQKTQARLTEEVGAVHKDKSIMHV